VAVLQLAPRDEVFERVRILARVARTILDVRIVSSLLVAVWLVMVPGQNLALLALCTMTGWLLLVLLRWRTIGWVLCTHPAVLAADTAVGFALLAMTGSVSPMLLVVAAGVMFTGVCLDRRGASYFAPLVAAAWWTVYAASPPERIDAGDGFVHVVVLPVLLIGLMYLGAGIRAVILEGAEAERVQREQTRAAGVAEERARMAREMHDSLTKSLHGIAMMADALPGWVERSPQQAADQARMIAEQLRVATRESRAMILAMRESAASGGVGQLVRVTVDRWQVTTGRPATCRVEGEPALPTESAHEAVAVLREALENVRRHTPEETGVEVALSTRPGWVRLIVRDRGPGAAAPTRDLSRPGHFGVLGMRERAARVGGRLEVVSAPTEGTSVELLVPASLDEADLDAPGGGPVGRAADRTMGKVSP
jgi:signal transduction histidine kinase